MYMCVRGIYFASVFMIFPIGFWNCLDSVVFCLDSVVFYLDSVVFCLDSVVFCLDSVVFFLFLILLPL